MCIKVMRKWSRSRKRQMRTLHCTMFLFFAHGCMSGRASERAMMMMMIENARNNTPFWLFQWQFGGRFGLGDYLTISFLEIRMCISIDDYISASWLHWVPDNHIDGREVGTREAIILAGAYFVSVCACQRYYGRRSIALFPLMHLNARARSAPDVHTPVVQPCHAQT